MGRGKVHALPYYYRGTKRRKNMIPFKPLRGEKKREKKRYLSIPKNLVRGVGRGGEEYGPLIVAQ